MVTEPRTPQSQLAPLARLARDPDPDAIRKIAKALHNADDPVIVLKTSWLTSWADRKQAEILADKVHGKRGISR